MVDLARLEAIVGRENIREQEPMSAHTSFRIGGPARVFVTLRTAEQIVQVCRYLNEVQETYFLLGNGSNLLVSDEGYDGVVLCTRCDNKPEKKSEYGEITLKDYMVVAKEDTRKREELMQHGYLREADLADGQGEAKTLILAGAGMLLSHFANAAAGESLSGFEFASGIPGSLGGAVTMNAGAYGGQIDDVILSARVLTRDGAVKVLCRRELALGYRRSVIQTEGMVVLDALFGLTAGKEQEIRNTMQELNARRREKQPLEYGSAGSTFKRPEGYFAGKLIEDAGMKGYRVGDVMVSEKHAGFVVNVGSGTCEQAMAVISHVQNEVERQFGVKLETEVKMI